MSKTMNLPQISKILQDFERESSSMDMKEEMMSDTIDDVMEDEGETEEEESDKILKQVLDEIGVSVSQQVRNPFHSSARLLHELIIHAIFTAMCDLAARRNTRGTRCTASRNGTETSCSCRRRRSFII